MAALTIPDDFLKAAGLDEREVVAEFDRRSRVDQAPGAWNLSDTN